MRTKTPDQAVMSFGDHLEDLRRRVVYALLGTLPILIGALVAGKYLLALLLAPLQQALLDADLPASLQATSPLETFGSYVKVAIIVTILVASPWILYQLWLFVAPGLYTYERRFAYILAPMSVTLTALGTVFLYTIMLPVVLAFFIHFGASVSAPTFVAAPLPPGVTLPSVPILRADPDDPAPGQMWINTTMKQLRVCVGLNGTWANADPRDTMESDAADPGDPINAANPGDPNGSNAEPAQPELQDVPEAPPADGSGAERGDARVVSNVLVVGVTLTTNTLIAQQYRVSEYVKLFMSLALAFAVGFQMPVVVLLLGWAGVVDVPFLSKYRRHAVVVCAVLGAVLTPADPVSMLLLALPLWILYELGAVLLRVLPASRVAGPKRGDEVETDDEH